MQFLRWGHKGPCVFYLGLLGFLLFKYYSLSESSHHALRSPSHTERPWLGALVIRPSWEPASTDSHGNEPSWTPSPAEPSYDFTSSCHLTVPVWLSPSQNHPAEPGQATEPRETKINVCVEPSSFGVVCYIEMDNWNALTALQALEHVNLPFSVLIAAVTVFPAWLFINDSLFHLSVSFMRAKAMLTMYFLFVLSFWLIISWPPRNVWGTCQGVTFRRGRVLSPSKKAGKSDTPCLLPDSQGTVHALGPANWMLLLGLWS